MSSPEPAAARKKRANEAPKKTSEDDHRRKRRNRTTQSCLNCHTSKRMCDRKRPCGRCTQLGLTGLCVYEVDDPNQRADTSDEKTRLQKRVAELESVIRELKNKPHPRWVQTAAVDVDGRGRPVPKPSSAASSSRCASEEADPSGSSGVHLHLTVPSSMSLRDHASLSPSSASSSSGSSGLNTPLSAASPSPALLTPVDDGGYDLSSILSTCYQGGAGLEGTFDLFDGLIRTDGLGMSNTDACAAHPDNVHCGCLGDAGSYNVVLELSLRLRRAAETLAHYSKHHAPSTNCQMHQRIADLDRYTTEALANVNTPSMNFSPYANLNAPTFSPSQPLPIIRTQNVSGGTVSPQLLHPNARPWDYKSSSAYPSPPCEDGFMTWEPTHRSSEWPQQAAM